MQLKIRAINAFTLACTLCLGLTGCIGNQDDLDEFIAQTKSVKGKPPKPYGKVVTYESYAYPESQPRNPFEQLNFGNDSRKKTASNSSIKPDFDRPQEDLEKFPLDSLRMVGTIEQDQQTWALIKEPGAMGIIHRVTRGNHLGLNFGKIIAISETGVEIREIVSDGSDNWKYQDALLALSQ